MPIVLRSRFAREEDAETNSNLSSRARCIKLAFHLYLFDYFHTCWSSSHKSTTVVYHQIKMEDQNIIWNFTEWFLSKIASVLIPVLDIHKIENTIIFSLMCKGVMIALSAFTFLSRPFSTYRFNILHFLIIHCNQSLWQWNEHWLRLWDALHPTKKKRSTTCQKIITLRRFMGKEVRLSIKVWWCRINQSETTIYMRQAPRCARWISPLSEARSTWYPRDLH